MSVPLRNPPSPSPTSSIPMLTRFSYNRSIRPRRTVHPRHLLVLPRLLLCNLNCSLLLPFLFLPPYTTLCQLLSSRLPQVISRFTSLLRSVPAPSQSSTPRAATPVLLPQSLLLDRCKSLLTLVAAGRRATKLLSQSLQVIRSVIIIYAWSSLHTTTTTNLGCLCLRMKRNESTKRIGRNSNWSVIFARSGTGFDRIKVLWFLLLKVGLISWDMARLLRYCITASLFESPICLHVGNGIGMRMI